jgi:hypothetical protein
MNEISALAYQVLFYSILNSIVVYGLLCTFDKLIDPLDKKEDKHSPYVALFLTYGIGAYMGLLVKSDYLNGDLWPHILIGVCIGSTSVAAYKAVIKSFLEIIPRMVDKVFEKKND